MQGCKQKVKKVIPLYKMVENFQVYLVPLIDFAKSTDFDT